MEGQEETNDDEFKCKDEQKELLYVDRNNYHHFGSSGETTSSFGNNSNNSFHHSEYYSLPKETPTITNHYPATSNPFEFSNRILAGTEQELRGKGQTREVRRSILRKIRREKR